MAVDDNADDVPEINIPDTVISTPPATPSRSAGVGGAKPQEWGVKIGTHVLEIQEWGATMYQENPTVMMIITKLHRQWTSAMGRGNKISIYVTVSQETTTISTTRTIC
jgi:hypothetical protein